MERIMLSRRRAGLTQQQLAEAIGVQRAVISKYENGTIEPSITQVSRIADALGVSVSYLIGQSEDPDDYDILNPRRASIFRERANEIIAQADTSYLIEEFGTVQPYKKILDGATSITRNKAREIAEALGVSLNYLIGTTDDPDDTSLPEAELLLAIEKESERIKEETLQEKESIERNAPKRIKDAQDVLLKTVMEICKDPAPLNEVQELYELEIMPARIIHVRDFLLLKDSLDFLSNNMPGLTCTTRPKRNNAAESELLFYFRNAAPELQKAALAVLKSASSEKISTANEE